MVAKQRVNSLAATVYLIWNAKNRAIFDGELASMDDIVRRIQIVVLWCLTRELPGDRLPEEV